MKGKINNSNSEDFQLSLCNAEFYVGVLETDVLCCTSPSKSLSFVNSHVSHMCYFSAFFSISFCVHINVKQAHVMAKGRKRAGLGGKGIEKVEKKNEEVW